MSKSEQQKHLHLTRKILIAMVVGGIIGVLINLLPESKIFDGYIVDGLLDSGGKIFISIMKMIVVPIVFVSLVSGTCSLSDPKKLGRIGIKTISLYIFTTMIAITIAITLASLLQVGVGAHHLQSTDLTYQLTKAPSVKSSIINIIPANPFEALSEGNMLQIIVFAILLGIAIAFAGSVGERIKQFFYDMNEIIMGLVLMMIRLAPYGVFCLITVMFAHVGFTLIYRLMGYFAVVILALLVHVIVTNTFLIRVLARLNPLIFYRKMYSAILFAFSTSSSSVSIPVVLNTVENKLGVKNSAAAFIIPLGATINMDGTAIMQGVATVFIAHVYGIPLGLGAYLTVILTATLASIGTAGVPSVGLITLTMVLQQVGLPIEGIAMIIGVDRILDMIRTGVNVTGDSAIACVVGRSENAFSKEIFDDRTLGEDSRQLMNK